MKQVAVLCLVLSLTGCSLAHFPFQRCNARSPNINQCLSNAILQGIHLLARPNPLLGTPGLEPLKINHFAFEAFGENYHLDAKYTNYEIHGLTHLTVPPQVQFDLASNTLVIEFAFPELLYKWDMNYIGQIFGIRTDVTGIGSKRHKRNFRFTFKLHRVVGHDGQEHYQVLDADLVFPPESVGVVQYQYETVRGSSITGAQLSQLYNQHRDVVTKAVTHEYELTLATIAHQFLDSILSTIPANLLFGV